MNLGIGGHFDVKCIAGLGTDEGHQVAGVMELAAHAVAAGQVAAQSHQTLNAHGLQLRQLLAHSGLGRAHAGKV